MPEWRTNVKTTADSLEIFTGKREMQLLSRDDPQVAGLTSGRYCLNCGTALIREFVMLPSKQEILIMCGPCIRHIAGNPQDVTEPAEIHMAVSSLTMILQDA